MLNKLLAQLKEYKMLTPGDSVVCAVSGGADSVALLWGMYLLKDKLGITLSAAHFNHQLRGGESDRDEAFVRQLCDRYDIPLFVGSEQVQAGEKGLEAAAREARYRFLKTLPGKIATAHTADDNAETVLMHLVRGTGLKGLGGIAPVNGSVIRPMLTVTRKEVLAFIEEYHLAYVEDSSNSGDDFLRNRLRHRVMPLLKEENPSLAENLSQMAMDLRHDAKELERRIPEDCSVTELRELPQTLRSHALARFLKNNGVPEPERAHIRLLEQLVFSQKPSAWAAFPNGVIIAREYDRLIVAEELAPLPEMYIQPGDSVDLPQLGLRLCCVTAEDLRNTKDIFTVKTNGPVFLRSRKEGDAIRLNAGTKSLKKLFVDRKIPAHLRQHIPVLADEEGVLGVWSIGGNVDRLATNLPALQFYFEGLEI